MLNFNKKIYYFFHIFAPLLCAFLIYILFRPVKPFIFDYVPWKIYIDLSNQKHLDWFVYNLPDGIWAYSFTSFLLINSFKNSYKVKCTYITIGILLMLGYEVGQNFFIIGTFDIFDLVAIAIGISASILVFRRMG